MPDPYQCDFGASEVKLDGPPATIASCSRCAEFGDKSDPRGLRRICSMLKRRTFVAVVLMPVQSHQTWPTASLSCSVIIERLQ